jgi:hypothetical protein
MGEPVFDFQFYWEGILGITNITAAALKGSPVKQIPQDTYDFIGSYSTLPDDLKRRLDNISPISVRFQIGITDKSFFENTDFAITSNQFSKRLRDLTSNTPNLDENIFVSNLDEMDRSKITSFSIDLPAKAGVWQTFSVPGSPEWSDLPKYFKTVFKLRKDPSDLVIKDIKIVEIRWPQKELEDILLDAYNRRLESAQSSESSQAGFWDSPTTSTQMPLQRVSASEIDVEKKKPALTAEDQALRTRYTSVEQGVKEPFKFEQKEPNKLIITASDILTGDELLLRDSDGRELGRMTIDPKAGPLEVVAKTGLDHIDVLNEVESIGTIKWGFVDIASLVSFGFDKGFDGSVVNEGFIKLSGYIRAPISYFNSAKILSKGLEQGLIIDATGHFESTVILSAGPNTITLDLFGVQQKIVVTSNRAPSQLRATMTWDRSGSDMDLHMISPAGDECYYDNKNIDGMSLDVDNTDGYGPENIYVPHMIDGTYCVYAKAYKGNAVVTITIFKNEQYYDRKTISLSEGDYTLFFNIKN